MGWAFGTSVADAGAAPTRPVTTRPVVANSAAPIEARTVRDLLTVRTLHSLVTGECVTRGRSRWRPTTSTYPEAARPQCHQRLSERGLAGPASKKQGWKQGF